MADSDHMRASEIHDFRDALRAIWLRSAYDRGFISNPFWGDDAADLGLRRTRALLDLLGNPQERYGIVHGAGSKGKGSTCAFLSAIGTAAEYKTGLYTSPHLHSFRERIAVDGVPISELEFANLTRNVLVATERLARVRPELGEITAFELLTAMAFHHFAEANCNLAVIEVGLGGTLDATNVVNPTVSVITALDYEHTRVLGSTLAEIAVNKAGIIKPGKPVVTLLQEPEALDVIEAFARENQSPVLLENRDWHVEGSWRDFNAVGPWGTYKHLRLNLIGTHQTLNAGAAIAAAWQLNENDYTIPEIAIRQGLETASWPGRFEIIDLQDGPRVILDGAHTPASARALTEAILAEDRNDRRIVVLGMMSDKDSSAFVRELAPVAVRIIATSSQSPRAARVAEVLAGIESASIPAESATTVPEALAIAIEAVGKNGTVIVTGSLTTVAEAREALGLAVHDPAVDDESYLGRTLGKF
jgi:dihydrofolate synthase/folylpolyglutamate synthase